MTTRVGVLQRCGSRGACCSVVAGGPCPAGAAGRVAPSGGPVPVEAQCCGVIAQLAAGDLPHRAPQLLDDLAGMPIEAAPQEVLDVKAPVKPVNAAVGNHQQPVPGLEGHRIGAVRGRAQPGEAAEW